MNIVNNAFCPDAYLFKANLEGQTNRLGKREINWHIAACARKKDIYVLNTYLHILYSTFSMSPGFNWCSQGCGKSKINSPGSHHVRKCKSLYNLHALYQENKAIINSYNLQSASLRWKGFMRQKSITHQISHQKKYQRRKICPGCLANGKGKKKSIRRILNLLILG